MPLLSQSAFKNNLFVSVLLKKTKPKKYIIMTQVQTYPVASVSDPLNLC